MPLLYLVISWLATPLMPLWHWRRIRRGKEDRTRWKERYGIASRPRPAGRLLWCHGASMGESLSLLPLIERLIADDRALSVLVTTGTRSSAETMATRLPERAFHQFVPYDLPFAVENFLAHWRPDAALWVESELWPNLLLATARRCPTALVNARMSPRSSERWQAFRGLIGPMLASFRVILAQSEEDAARLRRLGAKGVTMPGNLKLAAAPLPADPASSAALESLLGARPRLLFASTHPGEEEMIGRVHRQVAVVVPDLLSVVVPRHAVRGHGIAEGWRRQGFTLAQRSRDESPGARCEFYLADSMGELALFYRACGIAFIGGSLVPHGGQNPLEAARLGCAVLYGPHMQNFVELSHRLEKAGGALRVGDAEALAAALIRLLQDGDERRRIAEAGKAATEQSGPLLDRIVAALSPVIPQVSA